MTEPALTPSAPRVLVILNPVSGQGEFEVTKSQIVDYLDSSQVGYDLKLTEKEGDAREWAVAAREYDRIIVGGGDGTVMEALSGVIENRSEIPLAQIPMGTANLLARAVGVPIETEEALGVALESGVSVKTDVGHITDHDKYFALVAGAGWDAEMIENADREMKNRLGFFAYIVSGIRELFKLRRSRVRITIDGKRKSFRAHTVTVINIGDIFGASFQLAKNVSPHDGSLDLAIASAGNVWGIVKMLSRILRKQFDGSPDLSYFSVQKLTIEASPPLKLEIDGEVIGETPFSVEIVPDGIRLIVPPDYAEEKDVDFCSLENLCEKE